jgi:predicted enzyme related to lactoylglutathione lyase
VVDGAAASGDNRHAPAAPSGARQEVVMGRPVVHWELWSKDPARAADFYCRVFDWKVEHIPAMDYRLVQTGGGKGIDGGITKPEEGGRPGNMACYIEVEDLRQYRDRIVEAGGRIVVEEVELPNVGAFSLFEDPDGRVMGLWRRDG